jgi:hypothetical protein
LFSGKNKMKRVLLIAFVERTINNLFLLSVGFPQQAFYPVPIVSSLKKPFARTEHYLGRIFDR